MDMETKGTVRDIINHIYDYALGAISQMNNGERSKEIDAAVDTIDTLLGDKFEKLKEHLGWALAVIDGYYERTGEIGMGEVIVWKAVKKGLLELGGKVPCQEEVNKVTGTTLGKAAIMLKGEEPDEVQVMKRLLKENVELKDLISIQRKEDLCIAWYLKR